MATSTKPPKGFRDFLPDAVRRRERVFQLIREVYEAHGFEPLDTPCTERLDTLLGKYGDEGDQLLFKVLKRGASLQRALTTDGDALPAEADLADMGLRYDLTVPLARVYAEHRNDLPRYFKRYQLAPVWRADRPQRGRFREFYQCDVDIVGAQSVTAEAEVCSALATVLNRLEFDGARIHINHRMLLRALIEYAGIPIEQEGTTLVAIDKLDKIGVDGVTNELLERGISQAQIDALLPTLDITTTRDASGAFDNATTLARFDALVGHLDSGREALDDLQKILAYSATSPAGPLLCFDPFLARGLSYYTGAIFEIRSDDFRGSLGGGGRYDGLIGMFMKESVPACGFSLGVERILVLMAERDQLTTEPPSVDVLVTVWNEDFLPETFALTQSLRAAGLRVDLYQDCDKFKKQFAYANDRAIPIVATMTPRELEQGVVKVKDMRTGDQEAVPRDDLITHIQDLL